MSNTKILCVIFNVSSTALLKRRFDNHVVYTVHIVIVTQQWEKCQNSWHSKENKKDKKAK